MRMIVFQLVETLCSSHMLCSISIYSHDMLQSTASRVVSVSADESRPAAPTVCGSQTSSRV